MRELNKKVLSVAVLVGVFLLGFYLGADKTGNNVSAQTGTHVRSPGEETSSDSGSIKETGHPTTASAKTTPPRYLPIIIRNHDLSIQFPIGFQLQDTNKERYLYTEENKNSRIRRISVVVDKETVCKEEIKGRDCTIQVDYEPLR